VGSYQLADVGELEPEGPGELRPGRFIRDGRYEPPAWG